MTPARARSSHNDNAAPAPQWAELVGLFVSELPDKAAAIEHAWESREAQGLRRIAHQLKGVAESYGFPEIGHAACRIELILTTSTEPAEPLRGLAEDVEHLVDLCRRASVCTQTDHTTNPSAARAADRR